jgi:hypothetical protein
MSKRGFAAGLALAVVAAKCNQTVASPAACAPVPAIIENMPPDTVWGFVDLHTHPGIEKGFFGRMVWGTALDDALVDASQLPSIAPCPVETHDQDATSPVDRAVGEELFPEVAGLTGFAHAPVGSVDFRPTSAWPNGRDAIHQAMNVSSIRRAYESGLRLMFATPTDDQVISALLAGPNMHDGFVPQADADYESARAQLDLITEMVQRNAGWMSVARSPKEARAIIHGGKLAIVLGLEMEGLRASDVDTLREDYGVRHVIPVHLIDNDIGGTAANGDLFNAASAEVSELYRSDGLPHRYMDVAAAPDLARLMGLPEQLGTLGEAPVYAELDDIPYATYSGLCYEPLAACSGTTASPTSFIELGQENARGLCSTLADCNITPRPGVAAIRHFMDAQMFIDVSHMGRRSVEDTLDATEAERYPILATHGDIAHLCRGTPAESPCIDATTRGPVGERWIEGEYARTIARRGGVLGLGTGMQSYALRGVLAVRGGPLLTLNPSDARASACVAPGTAGCTDVVRANVDATKTIDSIEVQTIGGISGTQGNAQPFLRVEMRSGGPVDAYQHHVFEQPMSCTSQSCDGVVALGMRDDALVANDANAGPACAPLQPASPGKTPYTIDDVESVTLEWLYLACGLECQQNGASSDVMARQCQSTWGSDASPHWTIDQVDFSASLGHARTPILSLGATIAAPLADLHENRGKLLVYARDDRPEANADVPATGHLLKVSMRSAPGSDLLGASPDEPGANVCVAIRQRESGACVSTAAPLPDGATECDPASGWWPLNQRGEWASNITLYAFARFAGNESDICGLDVSVLDWQTPGPFSVDEVKVESMEDPLGHWIRRYAEVENAVAGGRLGVFGFGTDFNGLNGEMDISEFGLPADARAASVCPGSGNATGPASLAPMRFRNADGSVGAEVRIDDRGLGTYGMLADMLAIVSEYPGCGTDIRNSLMLSAEATLRAWEAIVDPITFASRPPLPTATFACGPPPGVP